MKVTEQARKIAGELGLPPEYVQALLVEKALRARAKHANRIRLQTSTERMAKLRAALFPKQRAFVEDQNITKAALCTARAGKTFADCAMLIEDASDPKNGFDTAYVTITLKEAKRIMWNGPSGLKAVNREYDLGLRFNNADLVATTEAGHQIVLNGAETEDDIEKMRGQPFKRVVVDEAQSFRPHIDKMIKEVLVPRLLDYGGGLAMTGTPGEVLAGLFYEVTTGQLEGWTTHQWSLRDNPHIPKVKTPLIQSVDDFIRIAMRRLGWMEETPAYQREFMGRWVRDATTLVYQHGPRNVVPALPKVRGVVWNYVIGLDLGHSQNKETMAFEVGAWSPDRPESYLIEGFKLPKLTLDEVAAILLTLQGREGEIETLKLGPFRDIVAQVLKTCGRYKDAACVGDPGGLGAWILDELQRRYSVHVTLAEKADKVAYIKTMNADLAATPPRLYVVEGNPVIKEWEQAQWALRADLKDKREEDSRFPNHLSDAALYLWRYMYHFVYRAEETLPEAGTAAYHNAMAAKMEREDDEDAADEQKLEWWEKDQ